MEFQVGDVVKLKTDWDARGDLHPMWISRLEGELEIQAIDGSYLHFANTCENGSWSAYRFELVRRAAPMVLRERYELSQRYLMDALAERDAERGRANRLADECGRLHDENRDLLAENARLRRQLEGRR